MKVILVATEEQENQIKELVEKIYRDIFPFYFSDDIIKRFERRKVLHIKTGQFQNDCTMKDAYTVITSLQIIISILEMPNQLAKYENLFQNNRQILNNYGLYFPFDYKLFAKERNMMSEYFSIYTKAANEFLI